MHCNIAKLGRRSVSHELRRTFQCQLWLRRLRLALANAKRRQAVPLLVHLTATCTVTPLPLALRSRPATTGNPSFTGGNDKKELASLSITDTIQIQNDLHGAMANHSQAAAAALLAQKPTSGGSQFTTTTSGTDSSTAFNHDNSLTTIARLDDDISALPPSETVAYRRAH